MKTVWLGAWLVIGLLVAVLAPLGSAPDAEAQQVTPCTTLFERTMPIGTQLPAQECAALEAIYDQLGGPSWGTSSGWGPGGSVFVTPCSMVGVQCETVELPSATINTSFSTVIGLALGSNNLSGELPAELVGLARLETLLLQDNAIQGAVPAILGELDALETVVLSDNELTGPLPPEIVGASLRSLVLESNRLTGPIPAELGALAGTLNLVSNQFVGPIPSTLVNVSRLDLADNQLSGRFPSMVRVPSTDINNNACITIDEEFDEWLRASERFFAWDEGEPCAAADDTVAYVVDSPDPLDVVANDGMPASIIDSFRIVSAPADGQVSAGPGSQATYTHAAGNTASESFGYEICSGIVCTAATVDVTITPPTCDGLAATMWGTPASEILTGTAGPDIIWAGPGDDTVNSGSGNDVVCGESGNDNIFVETGNDIAFGSDGNDRIEGGEGLDILRGGPGADRIVGGAGDDRLLGGIDDDVLDGGEGNDYLGGFGGADTILGGPGNETIFGGFGADIIDGGPGDDNIRGLIGNDTIEGGDGDDKLFGDRGNDTIDGQAGNDTIEGGNANDILRGGSGNDNISGGRADDQLFGGADTDTCIGNKENTAGDSADASCELIFGVP